MENILKTGEWLVHRQYGVGQIKGIETKNIGGKTGEYFRVGISTGVYWLPNQQLPEYVRFISSEYNLLKALRAMSEKPNVLSKNYKIRNKEVADRANGATLLAKGELVRDLNARKYIEGVNTSIMDERQLTTLHQQFLREMSVILDISMDEAAARVNKALDASLEKSKQQG